MPFISTAWFIILRFLDDGRRLSIFDSYQFSTNQSREYFIASKRNGFRTLELTIHFYLFSFV